MSSSRGHQLTISALAAVVGSLVGGVLGFGAAALAAEARGITNEPLLFFVAVGALAGLIAGFWLSVWLALRIFHRDRAALTAFLGTTFFVLIAGLLIALDQVLGVSPFRSFFVSLFIIQALSAGLAVVGSWFLVRARGGPVPPADAR